MANPALARLESALRDRKLDRTLTSALPALEHFDPAALLPSDVAPLDLCLRGGVPRGQVSELAAAPLRGVPTGAKTVGRTTVLLQMMAAATRRGELTALIDTCDRLDAASAIAAGIDLSRMLWVRGTDVSGPAPLDGVPSYHARPSAALDRVVDRALKALNLVLQAGGFGLVAIDLSDIPPAVLRQLPFTTWLRVQRTIEGRDTACVLVVPEPLARSAGGLTLSLAGRTTWAGSADRSRRLAGLDVGVNVISPRRRVDGDVRIKAVSADSR